MKINANYTWFKCKECGVVTKILPGQKFENKDDLLKLFECECKIKPKRSNRNGS